VQKFSGDVDEYIMISFYGGLLMGEKSGSSTCDLGIKHYHLLMSASINRQSHFVCIK
jgi:hypothetical protein